MPKNKKSGKSKLEKQAAVSSETQTIATPTVSAPTTPVPASTEAMSQPATLLFDFSFFIKNADTACILAFMDAVSTTHDGGNLKLLWDRAYSQGRDDGFSGGTFDTDALKEYHRGFKACWQSFPETVEWQTTFFNGGREQGRKEGEKYGREAERKALQSSERNIGQCIPASEARSFASVALQTDIPVITPAIVSDASVQVVELEAATSTQTSNGFGPINDIESVNSLCAFAAAAPSNTPLGLVWHRAFEMGTQAHDTVDPVVPAHVETGIQTIEPPLAPNPKDEPETEKITRFDWSDESELLPILQQPPIREPRDLSALRSSSPTPFSSLQRRLKRSDTHSSRQSHRRRAPFNLDFPHPPPEHGEDQSSSRSRRKPWHNSLTFGQPSQPNPPRLDWESVSRLTDLSRALKALGWVLAL